MHELVFVDVWVGRLKGFACFFKVHFGEYFQKQHKKIGTIGSLLEFIAAICDSEDLPLNYIDADVCRQIQDKKKKLHTYISITLSNIWFNLYFQATSGVT